MVYHNKLNGGVVGRACGKFSHQSINQA